MKSTLFAAAAALLAAAVSAAPVAEANYGYGNKPSCEGPYGELPCGSTNATWHTVQKGETLFIIAQAYKSGICDIASYNKIADPNSLPVGLKISIPADCKTTPDNTSCIKIVQPGPSNETCVKGLSVNPPVYVVIPNDTLTLISNNFGITLASLENANKQLANPNSINVGQKLNVPICNGYSCTNKNYTVKSGETFSSIATANGISIGQIESANPGQIPEKLQIGQVINVPVCSAVA